MPQPQPRDRFTLAALLGGCVFIGLQLISLTKWSVWHDESFTVMLIRYSWREMVERASFDVHPPLYYLLLKAWADVFGYSAGALRSFTVICMAGVFVLAVWLVCRLAGRQAAWWALPALALAPALVRYGQEVRMYGLAALLGLAATHVLLSLVQSEGKKRSARWWGLLATYVFCVTALLYTHYFASLILLTHWLVIWAARQRFWWVASYLFIGICYLPWLPAVRQQFSAITGDFWIDPVSITSFFSTLSTFLVFRPEWLAWHLTGWYALILLLASMLVGMCATLVIKTKQLSTQAKILLIGYWSIPMVVLFVLSLPPLTPYYYDRYFVTFSPLFYLLLGVGSWLAYERWHARQVVRLLVPIGLLACLLLGTYNTQVYGNNYGHTPDDFYTMKELSAALRARWQPGDELICVHLEQYFDTRFYLNDLTEVKYYSTGALWRFGSTSVLYQRDDLVVHSFADLHPVSGRVWIITDNNIDPVPFTPNAWTEQPNPVLVGYGKATVFTLPAQTFPQ